MPRKRSSSCAERAPAGNLVITAARIPGARRIRLLADLSEPNELTKLETCGVMYSVRQGFEDVADLRNGLT